MDGCGPHCGHFEEIVELEHLRSLITAWADADEASRLAGRYSDDHAIYESIHNALRKAVGQ